MRQEALMDLARNPKVAIKSGQVLENRSGSRGTALVFVLFSVSGKLLLTAPTKQQLHDVLWSEVSKWMNRSPYCLQS